MRYLPLTNDDRENMKKVIGISDINEVFSNVPKEVSLDPKFNLIAIAKPFLLPLA